MHVGKHLKAENRDKWESDVIMFDLWPSARLFFSFISYLQTFPLCDEELDALMIDSSAGHVTRRRPFPLFDQRGQNLKVCFGSGEPLPSRSRYALKPVLARPPFFFFFNEHFSSSN